jgi:hypothetical protein
VIRAHREMRVHPHYPLPVRRCHSSHQFYKTKQDLEADGFTNAGLCRPTMAGAWSRSGVTPRLKRSSLTAQTMQRCSAQVLYPTGSGQRVA